MKYRWPVGVLALVSAVCVAGSPLGRTAQAATPPVRLVAGPSIHVTTIVVSSTRPAYKAVVRLPQVAWPSHRAVVQRINAQLRTWQRRQVQAFAVQSARNARTFRHLPNALPPSNLYITGKATLFTSEAVSFALKVTPYFRGEAGPAELPAGLTFSLQSGQVVSLRSLFRPGTDASAELARFAADGLKAFGPASAHCYVGGRPASRDIRSWWLSASGLVLAFPAGVYTASYCGVATVTVTSNSVRSLLSPLGAALTQ